MPTELHLARLTDGQFLATMGADRPETWNKQKLSAFLSTHGYSASEVEWILAKADRSPELFIRLREAKPKTLGASGSR